MRSTQRNVEVKELLGVGDILEGITRNSLIIITQQMHQIARPHIAQNNRYGHVQWNDHVDCLKECVQCLMWKALADRETEKLMEK